MSPQTTSAEEKKARLDSWKAIADYLGRDVEAAYAQHEAGIIYLDADPAWHNLSSEPRFQALERKIGFTS